MLIKAIKQLLIQSCLFMMLVSNIMAQGNGNSKLNYLDIDSLLNIEQFETVLNHSLNVLKKHQKKDSIYAQHAYYVGYSYELLYDYEKALEYYQSAEQIFKASNTISNAQYALVVESLGYIHLEFGAYATAENHFQQHLQLVQQVEGSKSSSYSSSIMNLGNLYTHLGEFKKAEVYYTQALELDKVLFGEHSLDYSFTLENLGILYYKMNQLEKAEPIWLQAQNIRKKLLGEAHTDYALILNSLAALYEQTNRLPKAIRYYKRVLDIFQTQLNPQDPWFANAQNNLANAFFKHKAYEEAIDLHQQALALREEFYGKEHPSYSNSLNNIATCYQQLQQFSKAKEVLSAAQRFSRNSLGEQHPIYLSALFNYAQTLALEGNLTEAIRYAITGLAANSSNFKTICPQCFDSSDSIQYSPSRLKLNQINWNAWKKLHPIHSKQMGESLQQLLEFHQQLVLQNPNNKKHIQQLFELSQTAMAISKQLQQRFNGKTDKLRHLNKHARLAEFGINASYLWRKKDATLKAFSFAEQNKSILLAESIKGNQAQVFGNLPDSLIQQEQALQTQYNLIQKAKYESKGEDELAKLLAEENALNQQQTKFSNLLKEKYPNYHALKYENITAKAQEVQQSLPSNALMLEFFNTDSLIYLFVLSNTAVELLQFPISKKELTKHIKKLRKALTNYKFILESPNAAYHLFSKEAHWMYKNLLEKALANKTANQLLIIPDGELGHLPFDVFLVDPTSQSIEDYKALHYLIQDYTISYHYSATLWQENHKATQSNNNGEMLAYAAFYPSKSKSSINNDSILFQRPLHLERLRSALNPLPAAQKEINALASVLEGNFQKGKTATEAHFKTHAAQYGVIHLAMHGLLNKNRPMLSSLAFTEDYDNSQDNFLEAYEISQMKLQADLVVLSACETGYGRFQQGEGILSLARSFMYAGVPSLVVSLWEVNDGATAWIMCVFYQNLMAGLAKDAALRAAKLSYLEEVQGKTCHPAFWSPFIQFGNTNPIYLKTKNSSLNWWWLGIILPLLFIGWEILKIRKRAQEVA